MKQEQRMTIDFEKDQEEILDKKLKDAGWEGLKEKEREFFFK